MKTNFSSENNFVSEKLKPWAGSIILLPIIIYFLITSGNYHFIDNLNLLIHEGGHGIFSFFGKYIHALGGTLMQIIIPSMFIIYYYYKKNRLATQLFLIWLGENFFNISIYAADARTQSLHLIGGNKVYHDWHYLLGEIGLLDYDGVVGNVFIFLGIAAFIISLFIPIIIKKEEPVNINLEL